MMFANYSRLEYKDIFTLKKPNVLKSQEKVQ